jgi:hypothetical protein
MMKAKQSRSPKLGVQSTSRDAASAPPDARKKLSHSMSHQGNENRKHVSLLQDASSHPKKHITAGSSNIEPKSKEGPLTTAKQSVQNSRVVSARKGKTDYEIKISLPAADTSVQKNVAPGKEIEHVPELNIQSNTHIGEICDSPDGRSSRH